MNKKLTVTAFVVGTMLVSLTAYADGDSDRSSVKSYANDAVITTKIKAKLADAKLRTLIHVSVDTENNGAVVLTGTARSQEGVDRAGAIATATEGVVSVENDIKVVPDK
jgi:hyperosmotically inducible protein